MDSSMKETFEVLDQIEKVSSRNTKLDLLHRLRHNEFARWYFETIFNPYLTYGVVPSKEESGNHTVLSFGALQLIRDQLSRRQITGNLAREGVLASHTTIDPLFNRWIRRMWLKDLKIGISNESIEKVFPGLIPKFNLMLCDKLEDQQLNDNWVASPKIDGHRCVILIDDHGRKTPLSRNGKEVWNIDHILDELTALGLVDCVLDGELFDKNFQVTSSIVKASTTKKTSNVKYYVFDILTPEEWRNQRGTVLLKDRLGTLNQLFDNKSLKHLVKVPYEFVHNSEEAWAWAKKFKDDGFEGAVAKDLNAVYAFDRSLSWLKLKFVETFDLEIVGFKEGTGKNVGRLGAFLCRLPNGGTVQVGSGITDEQRVEIWSKKETYLGRVIEVECQEKTKDAQSLRFPIFVRFRDDK